MEKEQRRKHGILPKNSSQRKKRELMSDVAIAKDDKLDTNNPFDALADEEKDQEESRDDENVLHNEAIEGNTREWVERTFHNSPKKQESHSQKEAELGSSSNKN